MNKQLLDNNFIYVPKFIDQEQANALAHDLAMSNIVGRCVLDLQAPTSPAIYNLLPLVKLLVKKTPEVSSLLEEDVLPTYTYARIYGNGAELLKHTDRDACEISITLNLKQTAQWPICIKKPNGETASIELQPGDAMVYLGCDAEHWRDKFNGEQYSQVFLHYVRSEGPKANCFFDRAKV